MRQLILLLSLLLATSVYAATTIHLTSTASSFPEPWESGPGIGCVESGGPFNYNLLRATTTAPNSGTSSATTPSGTAPPCWFQDSSNQFLWWITPPFSGGVTIQGSISGVASGAESQAALNLGIGIQVFRWDGRRGGIVKQVHDSAWTAEQTGTSCATHAISGSAPVTSTAMAAGDRLIFTPQMQKVGGTSWGGNDSRTATICYNGAAAGNNELSMTFFETISLAADSSVVTREQVAMLEEFGPFWPMRLDAQREYAKIAFPLFWQPTIWQAEPLAFNSLRID